MLQQNRQVKILILAALLALASAFAAPAMAAERALLDVIGYSGDGRYFAFEEYGVQDGSGFAYSNIYVVDLIEDRWVIGTPVRVLAEGDQSSLSEIREEAQTGVAQRLADLDIRHPADVLAYRGDGEVGDDGLEMAFGQIGYFGQTVDELERYKLSLDIFKAPTSTPCMDWFGDEPMGFKLSLSYEDYLVTLFEDTDLPRSRGCPVTYKITGVYVPFYAQDLTHGVVILSSFPRGFEGPDRRFVAVPLGVEP